MDALVVILFVILAIALWPLIKAYALFLLVALVLYIIFRNNDRRL